MNDNVAVQPAEIAVKIDAFYALRQKRLELKKEVDALQANEKLLRAEIVELLEKSSISTLGGAQCVVSLVPKIDPTCTDWDALRAHILETGAWELIQKRLGTTAIRERWDDGMTVPGVEERHYTDLSVKKR